MNTTPLALAILLTSGTLTCYGQSEKPTQTPTQKQSQTKPAKTPEQLKERKELQKTFAISSTIQFKIFPQLTKIQSNKVPLEHQLILYTILKNTNEVASHQMRGESENRVFQNSDGREAVYDKDGDLVKNGYNDGTYNYAIGKDDPLLHFLLDRSPWLLWGLGPKDPTSIKERTYAYMGDLEGGIRRANAALPFEPLPEDHTWTEVGQLQTLALFVKAIELGQAEEIYDLFKEGHTITDEEIVRVLTKLNAGFDLLYAIPDS